MMPTQAQSSVSSLWSSSNTAQSMQPRNPLPVETVVRPPDASPTSGSSDELSRSVRSFDVDDLPPLHTRGKELEEALRIFEQTHDELTQIMAEATAAPKKEGCISTRLGKSAR